MSVAEVNKMFYEKAEKEFLRYYTRRLHLMNSLSADSIDECRKNERKLAEHAAQLLRYGVAYELSEQGVDILINNKVYTITKDAIRECMDSEEFTYIFKEEPEVLDKDDDDNFNEYETDFFGTKDASNNQNLFVELTTVLAKALSGVNVGNTGGFNNYQNSTSLIAGEIQSIEKKMKELEKSKTEALKQIDVMKRESETLLLECDTKSGKIQEELDAANEEIESLKEHQEKVDAKYAESLKEKESYISKVKEELRLTKAAVENLEESDAKYKKRLSEVSGNNSRLESEKRTLTEQLKTYVDQISILTSENEGLKRTNREAAEALKTSESKLSGLAREKEELEKTVSKLKQDLENLKKSSSDDLKRKLEEKEREIQSLESKIKTESVDKTKHSKVLEEKKACEEKAEELSKQLVEANKKTQELIESLSEANSDKKELENLAYSDSMTKVKNQNAFNKEFPASNRANVILAIIGICKIKEVNDISGRETGNRMIRFTASTLISKFGADNIYRVMGDQFIILFVGKKFNEVEDSIKRVQKELYEQRIDIAYGIAIGQQCSNHKEVLSVAEENMKNFKNSDVQTRHSVSSMPISNGTFEQAAPKPSSSISEAEPVNLSENELIMKALNSSYDDDDDDDDDDE